MGEQASLDWPDDFGRLLDEIQRAIEVACKRCSAGVEKGDVVQTVLLGLWRLRHTHDFKNRSMLFKYVNDAARHAISNEWRGATSRGRARPVEPSKLAELAPAASLEPDPEPLPTIEEMAEAIVDESQREIFRLRYVENLKQNQIGERLSLSDVNVSRRLDRARRFLRAKYGKDPALQGADA
jgi:RNA polymerase sigma factor (sigma-70 family)